MNKQESELVSELVTKTLGFQQSEIASLLFEIKEDDVIEFKTDALKTMLDKSAVKVAAFKDAETKAFDKGVTKTKAEVLSKFEGELKTKFGITTDKQGLELIEFAVAEQLKAQGGTTDEETIKRSSVYLNTVDRLTKEKEEAVKAETAKFEELNNKIQKESTFKTIAEQAKAVLDELKLVLPTGKTAEGKSKADIQIQRFLNELGNEYGFELKDGRTLVTKDGKILQDVHGNMIPLKDIVKNRALELWDPQEGEQRQGAGNNNDGSAGASGANSFKKYSGPAPKDAAEYSRMIGEAKTLEEKQGIMEAFETANKAK